MARKNKTVNLPEGFSAGDIKIEASICTGERTIGFYDKTEKKLRYAELVASDDDISDFYAKYGLNS